MGNFNQWGNESHPLKVREDGSGIWEGLIPGVYKGEAYKYHLVSKYNSYRVDKGDPYAFRWECPPKTASMVWDLQYLWGDGEWMKNRHRFNTLDAPFAIYEVHLGSWRRVPEEGNRFLTYREIAPYLVKHVKEMGFTHVEFLPVMEHPFYGSWGYQTVGLLCPHRSVRHPPGFHVSDRSSCTRMGSGLFSTGCLPTFPVMSMGLSIFDGTHLYEHADPEKGFHPRMEELHFQPSAETK